MRAASAVLAATRIPKAEMEEPTFGALTTERLAERGARIETQHPTAGGSARTDCEGRTGLPNRSRPQVHSCG